VLACPTLETRPHAGHSSITVGTRVFCLHMKLRFRFLAIAVASVLCAAVLPLAACSAGTTSARGANQSGARTPAHPVVAIGDSITGGHGLAPDDAWPILVARKRGWALTNLGTDGAGFSAPGASGETYDDQVADAADLHPDFVIISGSDNDIGQPADLATITTSAMTKLRAALPDATIIATSAIGPSYPSSLLKQVDTRVRAATLKVHGIYLDIGEPLKGRAGMLQSDGEHPTAAGQRVLADAIEAALTAANVDE